jgi:hypothetical protein
MFRMATIRNKFTITHIFSLCNLQKNTFKKEKEENKSYN